MLMRLLEFVQQADHGSALALVSRQSRRVRRVSNSACLSIPARFDPFAGLALSAPFAYCLATDAGIRHEFAIRARLNSCEAWRTLAANAVKNAVCRRKLSPP
jgi:hypothetical protein